MEGQNKHREKHMPGYALEMRPRMMTANAASIHLHRDEYQLRAPSAAAATTAPPAIESADVAPATGEDNDDDAEGLPSAGTFSKGFKLEAGLFTSVV